jgi:hypothetical protein
MCSIQRKRIRTLLLLSPKLGGIVSRIVSGARSPRIIMSNQRDSSTIYKLKVTFEFGGPL